jgi:hypothetical protein
VTPLQCELQKIKFRRLRTLRTANPICATCGEHRWWVRYELHHIAGRKYSDLLIRLCTNCHYGINILQNLLPKLDDTPNPQMARLIALLEGHQIIMEYAATCLGETATFLRSIMDKFQDPGADQ